MHNIIHQIITQTNLSEQQAWWLLEFVTKKTQAQLKFLPQSLTMEQQDQLNLYNKQIGQDHKPLAYILGWVPFLDLELHVVPPTLIPRPETEFWVAQLIENLQASGQKNLTILDIGTGSGCIALSLAQALPTAHIYAVDIAQSALDLATKNTALHNITNVTFLQSNVFEQVPAGVQFDLIVSNPPYIDPAAHLQPSVLEWEDHKALFAPDCGMEIVEKIITQAHRYLKKNDALDWQMVMEIDVSQGHLVQKLATDCRFDSVVIKKDQFDRDRTVWAK